MIEGWEGNLTEDQRLKLEWMRTHKVNVYAVKAPEDPLHDLPAEVVLEAIMDRHGVFKLRGHYADVGVMLEKAYESAKAVFDYIRDK